MEGKGSDSDGQALQLRDTDHHPLGRKPPRGGGDGGPRSQHFATTETRVSEDKKKVTYILQTSDSFTQDDLSTQAGVTSSGDSHCHTNQKKNSMDKKARTKLILASVLCLLFMSGEMVGGLLAHSLAIISDAAHLLTDFASFMISLVALYLANRPATKKLSFGWYRAEILGAFTSILMLWVLTGILVYSAVNRVIDDDYTIDATVMLITAATGVAFNILLGTTLHQHTHSHGGGGHGHSHGGQGHSHGGHGHGHSQGHRRPSAPLASSNATPSYGSVDNMERGNNIGVVVDSNTPLLGADASDESSESHGHSHNSNINVKAAFIHVIGDLFQSVGVLVAAFIIYFKPEWKIADPICTFMFSLFVLVTTVTIMRDIVVVLMEGTPRGINFAEVRDTFFEIPGVLDIHNLRVWSLTMDKVALSVHLAIDKRSDPHRVLKLASRAIQRKFNISETTMQVEEYVTDMVDCSDCKGP
ncbi:zinc transporter 2 [Aplysia californica]|uniref:Zinc transporter 2 n=1 Tax=Aplysia californica TaxID=6500 RepID=A0ABM1AA18_APLCA|nr:zinc transporter 2 [Aplysia californica]